MGQVPEPQDLTGLVPALRVLPTGEESDGRAGPGLWQTQAKTPGGLVRAEQGLALDPEHHVWLINFFKNACWIETRSYSAGHPARPRALEILLFVQGTFPPELIILHPARAMAFPCLGCGSHFTPVAVPGAIRVTGASRRLSAFSCPNTLFSDFRPYWSSL